jgi:hypothetical protein
MVIWFWLFSRNQIQQFFNFETLLQNVGAVHWSPFTKPVNSLKFHWNHLAYKDTFCCCENFKEIEPMVLWFEMCKEPKLLEPHNAGKNIMVISSLDQMRVSESKFSIFWVKY